MPRAQLLTLALLRVLLALHHHGLLALVCRHTHALSSRKIACERTLALLRVALLRILLLLVHWLPHLVDRLACMHEHAQKQVRTDLFFQHDAMSTTLDRLHLLLRLLLLNLYTKQSQARVSGSTPKEVKERGKRKN
jgi:hypothetical protein